MNIIGMFELRWQDWCRDNSRPDLIQIIKNQHFKERLRALVSRRPIPFALERGKPRCYTFLRFRDPEENNARGSAPHDPLEPLHRYPFFRRNLLLKGTIMFCQETSGSGGTSPVEFLQAIYSPQAQGCSILPSATQGDGSHSWQRFCNSAGGRREAI
jgi:hypothetical protein